MNLSLDHNIRAGPRVHSRAPPVPRMQRLRTTA